ncbi:hypothetical protein Bhyg_01428 [Pseudolycoriella hygida]|uniref:Uncharacterized protein n=1 Tax=Pseudolycoriella hygida TaxID=35572 RepID=A0A9Q0N9D5_9DIPT|nr:hypothetical protein Bhyg_01428 [Pseudolycoriella hygida]
MVETTKMSESVEDNGDSTTTTSPSKVKSETSVVVRCLFCPPQKILTVTANSAYNLNIHMKSDHRAQNDQFVEKTKKKKTNDSMPEVEVGTKPKQMKLDGFRHGEFVNQERVDQMVLNYIIDKVLPFSTVESGSFRELVLTGKSEKIKVMTRVKLVDRLIKEFQISKNGQIDKYTMIQYFCLTADLWSSRRRSFLGITIHWICPLSYSRKKGVLACRRITDIKPTKPRVGKKTTQRKKQLPASDVEFNAFRTNTLDPVLKKCQDLFNKQSNSSKAADLVDGFLNRYLVTPSPTRWNSLYDSVLFLSTLLDKKPEEMNNVITGLSLEKISLRDHAILKEFIKLTESLADALDVLQGEVYMYQGVFSPTIHKMSQKINAISDLKFCAVLKQRILESIEKRFPDYMKDDYLKASLLHPLFKSYEMVSASTKERLINELAVELQEILNKSGVTDPTFEL